MEEMGLDLGDIRPKYDCKFCNKDMTNAIQCHAGKPTSWKYLNEDEHCHFECYVQECVRKELQK